MYLKALEIQGFKSFPDKTTLNFGSAVTAIVGPNGSGKSNVSDAIRWVMGEQSTKSLRGSKMEDVIFGGTEKRGQMGFAQVTLVLDNSEHIFPQRDEGEIAVTRRYYRSGESEYYINKQSVRLSDVNELFMDTGMGREGYSIIGQGRVDEILSQKSADRREIFEEAAGISKYRHRKEKAERDLERTEENLTRVSDKLAELELQVVPLREQAEKAKQYLILRDELRALEISVWLGQLETLRANAVKLETDCALAQRELDEAQAALDAVFAETEQFGERVRENDMAQERTRADAAALDAQVGERESAVAVLRANIARNEESVARVEEELRDRSGRAGSLAEQVEEKRARVAALDDAAAALQDAADALAARLEELSHGMGAANDEAEALRAKEALARAAAADSRADAAAARSGVHELAERQTAIAAEREQVEAQLAETKRAAAENRRALDAAQEDFDAVENIIKGHTMKMEGRVKREQEASQRRVELTMALNNLQSRVKLLADMEKEYEGFGKAVRLVMSAAENRALRGVHGPVANLMTVEKPHALAIETALGARLQDVVVDTEEDAKAAIRLLKQRDGGRATFQPLSAIRGAALREDGVENESGFVGVAAALVRCEARYREVFSSMLGTTVVADDLDCGVAIARKYHNRFRVVTLDGQVINRGGSMTGGSASRSAGILSRAAELKELTAKQGDLREKALAAEREAEEAKRDLAKARYELETAQGQEHEAEGRVLTLTADKNHYDVLLGAARDRLDALDAEEETIARRTAALQERIAAQDALAAEQDAAAAACHTEAEQRLSGQSELQRTATALGDELSEKKSALAGNRAERETTERALRELETLREQMRGDEAGQRALIERYRAENEAARAEIAAHEAALTALREQRQTCRDALTKLAEAKLAIEAERGQSDRRIKERNENVLNANGALSRLEQKKAAAALEEKTLLDKLWETYELSYSDAAAQRVAVESAAKANRRIGELKRGIAALGSVSVGAIEQFEQVNGRYTYLTSQRDDIAKAKAELLGVIESITGEMTTIFREQFALIRTSFAETFTELFGGGKAALELEDESDPLGCGIEIKVQPPGKTLKTITLLSGGEKAFVAIALYFAILKVHPTPFCVMDEIEAALDEPNVVRVAAYMRRITGRTQFIVITHRRGTMEAADVLYGVTMQERGVSRVLTINMNEMSKELGVKG